MELNLNPYNIILFIGLIQGLTFGTLFFFVKRQDKYANRFLGLILFVFALYLCWVILIDFKLAASYPEVLYFPFSFILALGPSIYFYTLSLTDATFKFSRIHWWHYSPILLEIGVHFLTVEESWSNGIPTFATSVFYNFSPILQVLGIASITIYSVKAVQCINQYQQLISNEYADTFAFSLAWLKKLLIGYAIIWMMWVPYTFIDFLFFNWELPIRAYYPIYLFLSFFTLWIALEAYRRPEATLIPKLSEEDEGEDNHLKNLPLLKAQAKEISTLVSQEAYFLQSDLSLSSLSKMLNQSPNVLSRIINTGLDKNFSDFINEFRVEKMKELLLSNQYDHLTTEGIAYECGFNSRATAIRTFKKFTKMSPAQFRKINRVSVL